MNLWLNNYDKGQVHQKTLKTITLSNSPGAGLIIPTTTLITSKPVKPGLNDYTIP